MILQQTESFIDGFVGMYSFFHAQHIIVQILIIALLVAITVGAIALAYCMIKLMIMIFIWIIKAIIKVCKALFGGSKQNQASAPAAPVATNRASVALVPGQIAYVPVLVAASPNMVPVASVQATLHCPNCGVEFTAAMQGLLKQKKEVFCEACGAKLQID